VFNRTAVNFNDYLWTPYSILVLIVVFLIESILAYKLFLHQSSRKFVRQITLAYFIANVASFFSEYYLSIALNGGHRTLVWIPWVKIIGRFQLPLYLASFPIIFLFTILIEFIVALIFLKNNFKLNAILKITFKINLISTAILIIVFNCILFNLINGQEEGFFDDILPQIPLNF